MKIYNIEQLKTCFNTYSKMDLSKGFELTFKKIVKKRSNPQNALYWLWMACLEAETGNDKNYLHDYFRELYLPVIEIPIFDTIKKELTSTTKLSTIDFKNYLDKIQVFASVELGVILPEPTDKYYEQFLLEYEK